MKKKTCKILIVLGCAIILYSFLRTFDKDFIYGVLDYPPNLLALFMIIVGIIMFNSEKRDRARIRRATNKEIKEQEQVYKKIKRR